MTRQPVLALDTSTEYCSVAVCLPLPEAAPHGPASHAPALSPSAAVVIHDDSAQGLRFYAIEQQTGSVSSTAILPMIETVLAAAGIALADCGALAFGAGPGSFTGLRTATGIAQGLAFGANLPVVPVNTLMACAESARLRGKIDEMGPNPRVFVAVDARMSECYSEAFEWSAHAGEWLPQEAARVSPPESAVAPWPAGSAPDTDLGAGYALIGNAGEIFGERLAAFSAARVSDFAARPSGMAVASIGRRALLAGLALPPERALPEYVRDKVALTIQEREVERARRDAALLATRDKQDLNTEAVPLATTAPSKTPRSEPMNE